MEECGTTDVLGNILPLGIVLEGADVHLVTSSDDRTGEEYRLPEFEGPDIRLAERCVEDLQNSTPCAYLTPVSVILADARRVAQHPMLTATGRLAV